jgi:hypothetical protein
MAALGDSSTWGFLEQISRELSNIGENVHLREVVFVSLPHGRGMDFASDNDQASLFHFSSDGSQTVTTATLKEINETIIELDESIANDIELEKVHGVISVSCKPALFHQTLEAAGELGIPVTGTGGSSLSIIAGKYQVKLWGNAGGSVATTPLTKAISFSHALAKAWGLPYRPWLASAASTKNTATWRSVLNSCLPAFWAVVLCKRVLHQTDAREWLPNYDMLLHMLQSHVLPVTCAVVIANARSKSPGVLMGSAIAAMACERTVLGGLLAGWLVAFLEEKLLYFFILYGNVPATMTNLLTTGLVGILIALVLLPIAPHLAALTTGFREVFGALCMMETRENPLWGKIQMLSRSMLGAVFCYGSKIGWYHSFLLPVILIEMELGDPAFTGAMDQLTLVLVSAGICAGTLVANRFVATHADTSLLRRGLLINLLCGDFIEACYPLMEKNSIIRLGGYIASSCSVGLLSAGCKSSAYMPFPLALWLADDVEVLTLASSMAFGISFVFACLGSMLASRTSP